jgi:hypothetical protein
MNWAFVITIVLTAVEFVIGFFAIFSRWGSLVTTVVSTVSLLFSPKSPVAQHTNNFFRRKPSSPLPLPEPPQPSTAPSPASSRPSSSPTTLVLLWAARCSPSSGLPLLSPSAQASSGSSAYAAAAERAATRRWLSRRHRTHMRGFRRLRSASRVIRCSSGLAVKSSHRQPVLPLLTSRSDRASKRLWG